MKKKEELLKEEAKFRRKTNKLLTIFVHKLKW
jgi:hypothetical protein